VSREKTETRRAILRAAWRLLEQPGGHPLRLEDVAAAAGVTRQSVYDHFGSRTGLLVEMTRFVNQETRLDELIQPVRRARSGEEQLSAFIELQAIHTPRIAAVARATDEARRHDHALAAAWNTPVSERRRICLGIVRRLRREGRLAAGWTPSEAAELLLVVTGIRAWEDLVRDGGWSPRQYVRNVERAARRALIRSTPAGATAAEPARPRAPRRVLARQAAGTPTRTKRPRATATAAAIGGPCSNLYEKLERCEVSQDKDG
jgi:AcrR family transcriptional regulator